MARCMRATPCPRKGHTRLGDELARQRGELPWVLVEKDYRFDTDVGEKSLGDLFDGHSQLLVYHFMFGPSYQAGEPVNSSMADTVETFLRRYELDDPVLWEIAKVVHEADLADERFDAPEAPGLDVLLRGLSMV